MRSETQRNNRGRTLPLNNRYVLAAMDSAGERIAFLSESFEWVGSARQAVIFQSQIDANHFIEQNNLSDKACEKTPVLNNFDHVQPLFVTVDQKEIKSAENPDDAISFTGIYG